MKMQTSIKLFGIIGLVCLVTLSMISAAAAAPDVCRDLPMSANPGDTITVKLDITLDGADKTVIEDNAPEGWVVSEPSSIGSIVDSNTVSWIDSNNEPGVDQFTYKVKIPEDASLGTYTFSGEFDLAVAAPGIQPIGCDNQMAVVADPGEPGEPSEANVCRDLPVNANPGDTITVKLDIVLDGADKTVIEDNAPEGWVVSEPSGSGSIVDANTVSWIDSNNEPGVDQFTYKVKIPEDASLGTYTFSGEFDLAVAAPGIQPIGCDNQMAVVADPGEPGEPSEANVCRDLPMSANPGDTITVKLDIVLDGADKTVIEDNAPEGWVVSEPSGSGSVVDSNTVSWIDSNNEPGVDQFTYKVKIPEDAALGTYTFSGEFDLAVAAPGLQPIGCEDEMTVVAVVDPIPDGFVINDGWNFISIPFALNNSSVEFVLADTNYSTLMYWNASSAIWEIPTDFEPLKGYWIESNEGADQVISEERLEPLVPAVPPTMTVYPGWNAIGFTDSMSTLSAELVLASIDDSYTLIKGPYDSATMTYTQIGHNGETGVISGNHVGTDVFEMNPYEGYWVYIIPEDTFVGF